MKKFIGFLVLALGISTLTVAQEHRKGHQGEKMTAEQQTELAVKKMTLKLDLTPAQQQKIKPLLAKQIEEKRAMHAKRKAMKEANEKPSSDERYKMTNSRLDKQIAFKAEMKQILNKEQYERFEKMAAKKEHKMKKRMHKKGKRHPEKDGQEK